MSTYLDKEALLSSELITTDVEAFGGVVLVSELPGDVVQKWFESGAIAMDGEEASLKLEAIDMIGTAARVILDAETREPLLTKSEARRLAGKSYAGIQRCVMEAIDITDFGEGEAKN